MANSSGFYKKQFSECHNEYIGSCSVCLLVYDEIRVPKLLNCGHTFCLSCMQTLTTQQITIKCPTCRHETDTSTATLPTNYELTEVLAKLAEKEIGSRQNETKCQECLNSIALQKVRCCKSCNTSNSSKICSDCCVDHHNGHELVIFVKFIEQQRTQLIDTVEEHKTMVASFQAKIENQQAEISLLLAKIQSLAHARREEYDFEAASIVQDAKSDGAEIELEILQQQKSSDSALFRSTEAALSDVVALNEKILALETAAVKKLDGKPERGRGNSVDENLLSFELDDNELLSTNTSLFHSLDSARETAEIPQTEAASCSAENNEIESLTNEIASIELINDNNNGDFEQVVVIYHYAGEQDDELTIQLGEIIAVIEKTEENWWLGRMFDDREGFFPSNYVKPFIPSPT